jgi:hypothetical protein
MHKLLFSTPNIVPNMNVGPIVNFDEDLTMHKLPFSAPNIVPKMNAGPIANFEGDIFGEISLTISDIPPKAHTPRRAL